MVHNRVAKQNAEALNPSFSRNESKFMEAKLHAVSSKNIYSEHGLDALISPLFGQVCQELIVS